jgi:hypothetical protein
MDDFEQRIADLERAVGEIQEHMGYGRSHLDKVDHGHGHTQVKSVPTDSVIGQLHQKIDRLEGLIEQMQLHRA